MPTIRDVVKALGTRNGVNAVLVLGRDGLPIDSTPGLPFDPDVVSALIPSVVDASRKVGEAGTCGAFQVAALEYDQGFVIVTSITPETLMAVLVQPNTNIGPILFELRRFKSAIAGLL